MLYKYFRYYLLSDSNTNQSKMKTTTLNGKEYFLVVIDGDIVAQGLTEDLVFDNGYNILRDESRELWADHGRGFGPSDFITEYVNDNIQQWVKDNVSLGVVVEHNLN